MKYVMAIDQGTTSSRAILFDDAMNITAVAQEEFPQHYPASGWVEHDPSDLWSTVAATCRAVIEKAGISAEDIVSIGITNQRETTVVWDKTTGEPLHNDNRLAGPAHSRILRRDGGGRARADDHGKNRVAV